MAFPIICQADGTQFSVHAVRGDMTCPKCKTGKHLDLDDRRTASAFDSPDDPMLRLPSGVPDQDWDVDRVDPEGERAVRPEVGSAPYTDDAFATPINTKARLRALAQRGPLKTAGAMTHQEWAALPVADRGPAFRAMSPSERAGFFNHSEEMTTGRGPVAPAEWDPSENEMEPIYRAQDQRWEDYYGGDSHEASRKVVARIRQDNPGISRREAQALAAEVAGYTGKTSSELVHSDSFGDIPLELYDLVADNNMTAGDYASLRAEFDNDFAAITRAVKDRTKGGFYAKHPIVHMNPWLNDDGSFYTPDRGASRKTAASFDPVTPTVGQIKTMRVAPRKSLKADDVIFVGDQQTRPIVSDPRRLSRVPMDGSLTGVFIRVGDFLTVDDEAEGYVLLMPKGTTASRKAPRRRGR